MFQINEGARAKVYYSNPYFDKRLIEFCLNIGNHFRFKNGYPRSVLRLGMQNIMPDTLRYRVSKNPFLPDYKERYNQQRQQALNALAAISNHSLVKEVINIEQLKSYLMYNKNELINFLGIPRAVYLAQFLSSY